MITVMSGHIRLLISTTSATDADFRIYNQFRIATIVLQGVSVHRA